MIQWLRRPCGAASITVSKSCKHPYKLSVLAHCVPALRTGAQHRREYTGRLLPSSRRDIQTLVRAGRDVFLRGVPSEYKDDVARVVEQAEKAAETSWTTIHTGQTLIHQEASEHELRGVRACCIVEECPDTVMCRLLHASCGVACHAGHPAIGQRESCAIWGLQPGRAAEDHHGPARACGSPGARPFTGL